MDIYAAYHIKKLRWYLVIMLGVGLSMSLISSAVNPMPDSFDEEKFILENKGIDWEYAILGENPTLTITSMIIYQAVVLAVAVYLIRRWSKKWNVQLDIGE